MTRLAFVVLLVFLSYYGGTSGAATLCATSQKTMMIEKSHSNPVQPTQMTLGPSNCKGFTNIRVDTHIAIDYFQENQTLQMSSTYNTSNSEYSLWETTLTPTNRVTTLSRLSLACEAGLAEETGLSLLSFKMLPEWTGRLISNTKIATVVDVMWYSLPHVTGQGESASISCEDQLGNSSPNCSIWFAAEMDMGTIPDTLPSDWGNELLNLTIYIETQESADDIDSVEFFTRCSMNSEHQLSNIVTHVHHRNETTLLGFTIEVSRYELANAKSKIFARLTTRSKNFKGSVRAYFDATLLRHYLRSLTPTHIGIIALISLIFVSAASGFAFVMAKRQQQDGYYQLM